MMNNKIFTLFYFATNCIRSVVFPITNYILPIFIPKLKSRIKFEQSFNGKIQHADICFEVSSEGELEQILPILSYHLKEGEIVDLIYSSESVDRKIRDLSSLHENLRVRPLPILSFSLIPFPGSSNISTWTKASKLVLCRYDFFPELLLFSLKRKIYLVAATLKNKEIKLTNLFYRLYLKQLYERFSFILCSRKLDQKIFEKLLGHKRIETLELRFFQILARLDEASNKIDNNPDLLKIKSFAAKTKESLIIGSAWPEDIEILDNAELLNLIDQGEFSVFIAPHSLSKSSISAIEVKIKNILKKHNKSLDIDTFSQGSDLLKNHVVYIITIPGILCELYSFFDYAFIGGGFGRSIHSVLEPFMSRPKIFCGPKVHRSTEFDLIREIESNWILKLDKATDFYNVLRESAKINLDLDRKKSSIDSINNQIKKFLVSGDMFV